MGDDMQHNDTISAGGLVPGGSYALSIDTMGVSGSGVNLGTSDQDAGPLGHIVFDVSQTLGAAVARTGPCHVKTWIRHGGTPQDAPPVAPKYVLEFDVA